MKITDSLYDYISYLSEKGFLAGFGDNTFRPNNSITRAEFLKLIFLVSSTPLSTDTKDYFSDIKVGWQKRYINTGVHLGIVSTQNKKFNPNGSVTRSEALKMMIVLFVGEISSLFTEELFDVSGSEWYAKYIQYAIDNHLLEVSGNHFFPHKNITRYEVVSILKKLSYNK